MRKCSFFEMPFNLSDIIACGQVGPVGGILAGWSLYTNQRGALYSLRPKVAMIWLVHAHVVLLFSHMLLLPFYFFCRKEKNSNGRRIN